LVFEYLERDLKQYMDDCGGILAMNNVKVSSSFEYKHRGAGKSKNLVGTNYRAGGGEHSGQNV
jgi:hypothetical protein